MNHYYSNNIKRDKQDDVFVMALFILALFLVACLIGWNLSLREDLYNLTQSCQQNEQTDYRFGSR